MTSDRDDDEGAPPSTQAGVWPNAAPVRRARARRASEPPAAPPGGPLPDAEAEPRVAGRALRVFAVAGARGGTGTSMLAANLGLYLSTIGRRVVLVDADPKGASLHACLGLRPGSATAARASGSKAHGDGALPRETPFRGLTLLDLTHAVTTPEGLAELAERLRALAAEHVVVDLGSGLGDASLDVYLGADVSVLVTVPEPAAIEGTYVFLRRAFGRTLLASATDAGTRDALARKLRALGGAPSPLDLLDELERGGESLATPVRKALASFRPNAVVNQTRLRADLDLGAALQSVGRRRLGIALHYIGYVDHDDTVWTCARNRRPLLLEVPGARSSRRIEKIARRLLTLDAGKAPQASVPAVPGDSHHDLLEVERGATDDEIRRAYKRCRELYAPDALCCYGLFEPHEIEKLRTRVDEAFDVLLDPARRRPYELSTFPHEPEGAEDEASVGGDSESPPPPPEITPDTQFTGAVLRQARESQRMSLRDISQRTKISAAHLRAIEEDDFARLPAVVYTTGFVSELARCLRLEPRQVSRSYVGRYKRYLEDKGRGFVGG